MNNFLDRLTLLVAAAALGGGFFLAFSCANFYIARGVLL